MAVLRDVRNIDLSANQLSGDVSAVMAGWTHLEKLKLSTNLFESIPLSLASWEALTHFDISSNEIEGPIPQELASMTQLIDLDLSTNDFEGNIPPDLGSLTSLRALYMHGNSLVGSMPQAICDLRNGELQQLSVDCMKSRLEVECDCCTVCNDYDVDRNPFDR